MFKDSPKGRGNIRCYRGHADCAWSLKPSVMRDLRVDAESNIFRELMLETPADFSADNTMFEKLVRAQHYGLPTRLLDVSLNPLVGLFFACSDESFMGEDGEVKVFNFRKTRVKYADSDAVSIICNLARLKDVQQELIKLQRKRSSEWDEDLVKDFRKVDEVERLIHFVRAEKPHFLNVIKPMDLFKYFFVYPAKSNRRIIAQSGAFVVAGLLDYKYPEGSAGFTVKRIRIPASRKASILGDLDSLNINSRSMFPEIESASKYIKKKWAL
ncbi:FRG domain-containing protein [Pseudomonas sp. CCOS 191]|uniref:FRG domain-containing protein n=1 Tax=Pseudomonas sp. CCOS 191 TaxID=1649877 RepID=UPI002F91AA7C